MGYLYLFSTQFTPPELAQQYCFVALASAVRIGHLLSTYSDCCHPAATLSDMMRQFWQVAGANWVLDITDLFSQQKIKY